MYKDRGIIKWAPFDALAGFDAVISKMIYDKNKIDKPELTEDRLYQMDIVIKDAIRKNMELEISYFTDGYIKTIYNKILKIDIYSKTIILDSNIKLNISDIMNLEI